ncbi:hypothetical protein ACWEJQ_21865 [Streptomyces albidoflavus]
MSQVSIPLWTILRSREQYGCLDLPLLTVKSESGVEVRDLSQGRQPSEDMSSYRVVQPGDLVVNRLWARFGAYGTSQHAGVISPAYWVLDVENSKVDSRYLHHLLRSEPYRQEIGRRSKNMPPNGFDLPWDQFKKLEVPLLQLDEQRRIAEFLDAEIARIDRLIALQVTLRARIDERDKALRDNLVDELAKTVGEVPLRRFTTRIEQGASPQCEAIPRQGDNEWGVLKLSAVKGGHFVASENKRLPEETGAISAYQVRQGDLLVTRANTPSLVGDVAVVEGNHQKLLLPDLIYRVGLAPEMNADFVAQVALSGRVRTLIESAARGSSQSMVKLRGEDIKTWPMPMATQKQQATLVQEIQSGVQGTGQLRTAVARQLSLLAERRQSLITAAVTGQFDVSTASGRNVTDGVTP